VVAAGAERRNAARGSVPQNCRHPHKGGLAAVMIAVRAQRNIDYETHDQAICGRVNVANWSTRELTSVKISPLTGDLRRKRCV